MFATLNRMFLGGALVALLIPSTVFAALGGPYAADPFTTHLWHFDDFNSPTSTTSNSTLAVDSITNNPAFALRSSFFRNNTDALTKVTASGSTLGNPSLAGFGRAIDNTGGLAVPPDNSVLGSAVAGFYSNINNADPNLATNDNVNVSSFVGTNGAFTYEGLYRVDWDSSNAPGAMILMSLEEDSTTELGAAGDGRRMFQIYMDFTENPSAPRLFFDSRATSPNANPDVSIPLGSTSIGALEQGAWYHAAVTFNGNLNDVNNLNVYFTKVEANTEKANLVASTTWTNAWPTDGTADFAVGNSGRNQTGAFGDFPGEPWFGAIDEVRVSNIARRDDEFLFTRSVNGQFQIDRTTGTISLVNTGTAPMSLYGYSLESLSLGALDQTKWKSVADNYDLSGPAPTRIDSTGNWTELTGTGDTTDLSEFSFSGSFGTIPVGGSLLLGQAGAWIGNSSETDLVAEISLTTGEVLDAKIVYSGNGGSPIQLTDLNASGGDPNGADWVIFRTNYRTSLGGLSLAQAHARGDMDGDFDVDAFDFQLFRASYNALNGVNALELVMTQTVPEPATWILFALVGGAALILSRNRARLVPVGIAPWVMQRKLAKVAVVSAGLFVLMLASTSAQAALQLNYKFDVVDGSPPTGQTTPDATNTFVSAAGTVNAVIGRATSTPGVDFPSLNTSSLVQNLSAGVQSLNNTSHMQFYGGSGTSLNYVQIADASSGVLDSQYTNFSFSMWLNPSSQTGDRYAIGKMGGGGQRGWQVVNLAGTSTLSIDYFDAAGGVDRSLQTTNALPLNTWTHVLFTFDGVNQTEKLYLNNVLTPFSDTSTGGSATVPNTFNGANSANFRVGHRGGTASSVGSWIGGIDDVRIYDETLLFTATGSLTGTGSTLAEAAPPRILISNATGEIRINNPTTTPLEFSLYDIESPANRLLSTWAGLGNLNAIGPGDGQKWEKSFAPDGSYISELFLQGSSTIAPGQSLSLGIGYATGVTDNNMTFSYFDLGLNSIITGEVKFVDSFAGLQGDFNNDGIVNLADYTVWRDNLGAANEGALNGNGSNSGGVDAADYALWKTHFGATSGSVSALTSAVPEPAALMLLAMVVPFALLRRSGVYGSMRLLGMMVALACCSSGMASVTVDRLYTMGDDPNEGPQSGAVIGDFVSSSFAGSDVLDSAAGIPENFADLVRMGAEVSPGVPGYPVYAAGSPNASGSDFSVSFNGTTAYLSGPQFNTIPNTNDGFQTQGMQMWARPTNNTKAQVLIFDTASAGGPAITADGKWTQISSSHLNDTDITPTTAVQTNVWSHVMQHIFINNTPGSPNIVPGTGAVNSYTSVLYVNGVAVSANNDTQPAQASSPLLVGAARISNVDTRFFEGQIDELEMYGISATDTFNLFTDNDYIASQIALLPGGTLKAGDVNRDGLVNNNDVTAFVNGWLMSKRLNGPHADVYVGDWQTWGWGDMNTDGRVTIRDAVILHDALLGNGFGGLNFDLLGGATTVPEPQTALLLAAMASMLGFRSLAKRLR
jgi:hypothetical protein